MRCFIALDLPPAVRRHLAELCERLRRHPVRWVPEDQLHLTLVFAGELPDANAGALAEVVRRTAVPPLSLSLDRLGHFPPKGMPRVLWAGIGGDAAALAVLQRQIAAAALPLGVPHETRGFVPHVTLGRMRSQFGALALLDELAALAAGLKRKPFAPRALVLYRSTLTPAGPRHEPLAQRALGDDRITPSRD